MVFTGPLRQAVLVKGPMEVDLLHEARLDLHSNALELINQVNIAAQHNFEVAMRLKSMDFAKLGEEQFYTDLNGLQVSGC